MRWWLTSYWSAGSAWNMTREIKSTTGVYDVHRIANAEKVVPREWINEDGDNVTEEFLDYVRPLIQGQYSPMMVEGLPQHLTMNLKNYEWTKGH